MTYAPIALFVYNRPEHTRATVAGLQRCNLASQSDLVVFSDGPKTPAAAAAVAQVRDYIATISGFKTLTIIEQPRNLGLADSVIAGVTKLCKERGRIIVLEDDLAVTPHFLDYMNGSLDRYENESQVMQVAGYMFSVDLHTHEDALFLPFISSWGWATWQRAWQHFRRDERDFDGLLGDATIRRKFDLNGRYKYSKLLQAQRRKKIDSWAIFWYVSVFRRQGIALFPKKTLVRNIGFDGTGVNCTVRKFDQDELDADFRVSRWPRSVEISADADAVMRAIPGTRLSAAAVFKRLRELLSLPTPVAPND